METKITVPFEGCTRRVLKSRIELNNIDEHQEGCFVMNNLQVFHGYCDGEVDDNGYFAVFNTIHGIALPFNRLMGWFYKYSWKKKSKRRK